MTASPSPAGAGPYPADPSAPRHPSAPRRSRIAAMAGLSIIAAAALLVGCANASEMSCGDFLGRSSDDQKSTTRDLLEEGGNGNPSAMLLAAAQGSLSGYCTVEGDDATLADAMSVFTDTLDSIGATTGAPDPGAADAPGSATTAPAQPPN
ncbi:hypothetical protein [Tomitella gaofuii]|uniref:hypothetical protein n=1 Tax=Tomitella gaofuii TaxID=2760083 RepID=UPI0015FCE941|nr:hypothetical protein [Tomitella gaofuii]